MDKNNNELKDKLHEFIYEYNDIINEIYLLKNKIIDNSKIRYSAINEFLVDLEERTLNKLNAKKLELDNYSEVENSILSISIKLLEESEQFELKHNEIKELLLNNEEDYNKELNKFNILLNESIISISIKENLEELNKIGDLGYFDETLIDELINLLKKINILILNWKEIDDKIAISGLDEDLNNVKKHR